MPFEPSDCKAYVLKPLRTQQCGHEIDEQQERYDRGEEQHVNT